MYALVNGNWLEAAVVSSCLYHCFQPSFHATGRLGNLQGFLNMLAPFRSRAAYSLLQMPIKCLFCARHNTKSLLKAPVPFMRLCHHHPASGKSKSFLIKRNGKKEETCEEKTFIKNIKISSGLLILQKNRPALKPL